MSMKDPLHFPSYSSLPFQPSITNEPTTEPLQHYCFLAQITEISFVNRPRVTIDIGNAETAIIESNSRSSPTTFAWTDLKPGNTIAILYATRQPLSDGTIGIRADDLNRVMIFRSGISNLTCYADKLMAVRNKGKECFLRGCERKTMLIGCIQGACAVYCSFTHQIEALSKGQQKLLFSQTKDLEWLLEAVKTKCCRRTLNIIELMATIMPCILQTAIPGELIQQIFMYIHPNQVIECHKLCRHIRDSLNDPIFILHNTKAFLQPPSKYRQSHPQDPDWFSWSEAYQTAYSQLRLLTIKEAAYGSRKVPARLPPIIIHARSLKFLRVNNLIGTIPSELWTLKTLKHLDLRNGNLTGPLSPFIGILRCLRALNLSHNNVTGRIPGTLGDCTQLIDLQLMHNYFSGPIPPELGRLRVLRWLDLRGNQLDGEIPKELGYCTSLLELNLQKNRFTGRVPLELVQFRRYVIFNVVDNDTLEKVIYVTENTVLNGGIKYHLTRQGFVFQER